MLATIAQVEMNTEYLQYNPNIRMKILRGIF